MFDKLPSPAMNYRNQQRVVILEIFIIIWFISVNTAEKFFLIILISWICQTPEKVFFLNENDRSSGRRKEKLFKTNVFTV